MRILFALFLVFSMLVAGCDDKSAGPDANFPRIDVDGYYVEDYYSNNVAYVVVYNNSNRRFDCGLEGDMTISCYDTILTFEDTTFITSGYPPDTISIQGGQVSLQDSTVDYPLNFAYMHIDSMSYGTVQTTFEDFEVNYGFYQYYNFGQLIEAYAYTVELEISQIDMEILIEDSFGNSKIYYLEDIKGP